MSVQREGVAGVKTVSVEGENHQQDRDWQKKGALLPQEVKWVEFGQSPLLYSAGVELGECFQFSVECSVVRFQ